VTIRPVGLLLLALAASCGGGAALSPPGAVAAPARAAVVIPTVRFRAGDSWRATYTRADTLITTLPNGGQQRQAIDRTLALRWSVTRTPTGLALMVTVDSARIVGLPGSIGRAMEDSARGAVVRGVIRADGRVDSLVSLPDAAIAHALIADLPWLVPALGLAGGSDASWSDTLQAVVRFGVVDLTERTIRRSSAVAGDGTVLVSMGGTVSRDGASPQLHLSGTGTRLGTAIVELNGRIRAAAGRDSVLMSAMVASIGQSVQIVQIGGYTLTALP
jgi:hypothetical protein